MPRKPVFNERGVHYGLISNEFRKNIATDVAIPTNSGSRLTFKVRR